MTEQGGSMVQDGGEGTDLYNLKGPWSVHHSEQKKGDTDLKVDGERTFFAPILYPLAFMQD